ncbi:MAG TPA: HutD family protein [Casimicrobiaceae bacterium]|nr:HutD family protein [Casimicrobiaceae bacterium]
MIEGFLIRAADIAAQPWRNGGGRTRELLAWPNADAWTLRVSVADIAADGPFSSFESVVRWIVVLSGSGVELTLARGPTQVMRGDPPLRFGGEEAPMCRLIDGPTRDLNLMLRTDASSRADGGMLPVVDHRPWSPVHACCGVYAAVDGVCHVANRVVGMDADTLLWFDAPPPVLRFAARRDIGETIGYWLQGGAR